MLKHKQKLVALQTPNNQCKSPIKALHYQLLTERLTRIQGNSRQKVTEPKDNNQASETPSYVFQGSGMDLMSSRVVAATQSVETIQQQRSSKNMISVDISKLPLNELRDKSLASQETMKIIDGSLNQIMASCRSFEEQHMAKQRNSQYFQSDYNDNKEAKTVANSHREKKKEDILALQKKVETDQANSNKDMPVQKDPIIFQIETDKLNPPDTALLKEEETKRSDAQVEEGEFKYYTAQNKGQQLMLESLNEMLYKNQPEPLLTTLKQNQTNIIKVQNQAIRYPKQRLEGKNITFALDQDQVKKSRPQTAKASLRQPSEQNRAQQDRYNKLAHQKAFQDYSMHLHAQQLITQVYQNPNRLLQRNLKTGQSQIMTDDEICKRLRKSDQSHPQHNILLKKNPLILEKKNLQNNQEFSQEALMCFSEVERKNKQSKFNPSNRNSPFMEEPPLTQSPSKGKDVFQIVPTQHYALWNFLDRLQNKNDQPHLNFQQHNSIQSFEESAKQNSSIFETVQSKFQLNHDPKFSKGSVNQTKAQTAQNSALSNTNTPIQIQVKKPAIEDKQTLPIASLPNSYEVISEKSAQLQQIFNKEPELKVLSLKEKHQQQMALLRIKQQQQKTLQKRSSDYEQRLSSQQLSLNNTNCDLEAFETQHGTLALPRENKEDDELMLVQFKDLGSMIQLQSVATRCKSANNPKDPNFNLSANKFRSFRLSQDGTWVAKEENQLLSENTNKSLQIQQKRILPAYRQSRRQSSAKTQKIDPAIIQLREDHNGEILLMGPLNQDLNHVSSQQQLPQKQNQQSYRRLRNSMSSRFNSQNNQKIKENARKYENSKTENVIVKDYQTAKVIHPHRQTRNVQKFRKPMAQTHNHFQLETKMIFSPSQRTDLGKTNLGQESMLLNQKMSAQKLGLSRASNYNKTNSIISPLNVKKSEEQLKIDVMKSTERVSESQRDQRQLTTRRKHNSCQMVTDIIEENAEIVYPAQQSQKQLIEVLNPSMTQDTIFKHSTLVPVNEITNEYTNEHRGGEVMTATMSGIVGGQTLQEKTQAADSSQDIALFTCHNILPRSESEMSNTKNLQFGYMLTNVNFAALPDCVTIENVGTLSSARLENVSPMSHKGGNKENQDEVKDKQIDNYGQRNAARKKQQTQHVLQGLLYHRPVSAHHKGLSLSKNRNSLSFSQQANNNTKTRKRSRQINSSMPVQVVNSHYKMRQKQQLIEHNKDIPFETTNDHLHVLEVDASNRNQSGKKLETFTQAHNSIVSTVLQHATASNAQDQYNHNFIGEERPASEKSLRRGVVVNRQLNNSTNIKKGQDCLLQEHTTLRLQGITPEMTQVITHELWSRSNNNTQTSRSGD